jgi:hypothetical protein
MHTFQETDTREERYAGVSRRISVSHDKFVQIHICKFI